MAQVNVFYEPETEVLTIFWQSPRKNQICTELDNGLILIKDETTGKRSALKFCPTVPVTPVLIPSVTVGNKDEHLVMPTVPVTPVLIPSVSTLASRIPESGCSKPSPNSPTPPNNCSRGDPCSDLSIIWGYQLQRDGRVSKPPLPSIFLAFREKPRNFVYFVRLIL